MLVPVPEIGVMRAHVWWPDAPAVQVLRRHPDGVLHPVRAAYPLRPGATRRNLCANPSLEAGLNGYVQADGTPTLSTITTATDPTIPHGTQALRATIATAGSCGVVIPQALGGGGPVIIGIDLKLSVRPSSMTVTISWVDGSGGTLAPSSATLTANEINMSVGEWARQTVAALPCPSSAATATVKVVAGGLPAGSTVDLDGVVMERGGDGTWFDGDILGATWLGAQHLSASVLAPVITVDDGECPLDQAVTYLVANPAATGGRIVSEPVTLDSRGQSWLTHPDTPSAPIPALPPATFDISRALDAAVFAPLGREHPVVITGQSRRSPTGELSLTLLTRVERDALLARMRDGRPMLLRTPPSYGYDDMWLTLLDSTQRRVGYLPREEPEILTAPFVAVEEPSVLVA